MSTQKYSGSCHCGKVRYEIESEEIKGALSCNCSICQRRGHLLAFVPEAQFRLLSGGEDLRDYQFAKKRIHHYFCTTCGVAPFGAAQMPDGTPVRSINVRCLEGVDPLKLELQHYDGRSL